MSGRITASSSTSCMVTSGPIMYPVMEDQFLWLPRDATACLRVRGCRAAYRHDRQTLRWLPAWGRTQIVLFGVTSGSHMTDQVAALIGGSCVCRLNVDDNWPVLMRAWRDQPMITQWGAGQAHPAARRARRRRIW
jgi:hypothetical protein